MPSAYVREMTVGDILRGATHLYVEAFTPLFWVSLLTGLPGVIVRAIGTYLHSTLLSVSGIIVLFLGSLVLYTVAALTVSDICVGNRPSMKRSFLRAASVSGALLVVYIMYILGCFVGSLLFVVPGILVLLWYSFAPLTVVLEGCRGRQALRRSKALGKENYGRILGLLVIVVTLNYAVLVCQIALVLLISHLLPDSSARGVTHAQILDLSNSLLSVVIGGFTGPFFVLTFTLMYYDLRARKEIYDSVALAAELTR
jgi:hypothetical protein